MNPVCADRVDLVRQKSGIEDTVPGFPRTSAGLFAPAGIAVDSAGNLYIADPLGGRVRKVDTSGNISTVAGTGTVGYSGDGGPAASAQILPPIGLAVDGKGNLYIAESGAGVPHVRKVDASGIITTFVETPPVSPAMAVRPSTHS
jgi:sugar lactone lactonase YvrE